jgi:hypothetical protein
MPPRLTPTLFAPASLLYRDSRPCDECKLGAGLIATLRLFGPWALVLTSLQIAPVAIAFGDERDVVELLTTRRIKTSATWCYKKPGPERCGVTLHIKDGSLVLEGAGCGSFRVPVNGSNGRQTAKVTGNTISVSVTGNNGTGVNTYELSPDLTQCSYAVECPAGFRAKVFSCSVEGNVPTQASAPARSSDTAVAQKDEHSPPVSSTETRPTKDAASDTQTGTCSDLTGINRSILKDCPSASGARIDAQSYMDAAQALKEKNSNYNGFSAAAMTFRKAAAAYQAAGDTARAQAAANEAQLLEGMIKIADERAGRHNNQIQCGTLRDNAQQCYIRTTRSQPDVSSASIAQVGQSSAFLDCVKTYCSAMRNANCPMPIFGKDNAGFCVTAATDENEQESPTCGPGKHLVLAAAAGEPVCQVDGNSLPAPKRTNTGR